MTKSHFYCCKQLDRKRVALVSKNTIEMHRSTRVDYYATDIEKVLNEALSFKRLNRYPNIEGLYSGLSKYHCLNESNILVTSGIDGGIKTVFEMCTQKGSNILYMTPTYAMYDVYSEVYEVKPIKVSSSEINLSVDVSEILDNINEQVDVVFIVNPHEPIENVFSIDELKQILKKSKENNSLVFIDEAYYMFGAPSAIGLINEYDNLVVARTFSKGLGLPAIRVGYLVGNQDLINYLTSKRLSYEVNSFAIDIALYVLDHIYIAIDYNEEVCSVRDWLIEELDSNGYRTHGCKSNSILIDLGSKEKADFLTEELKKQNIMVRGYLPYPAENYISLTIGSKKIIDTFYDVFKSIIYKSARLT